MRPTSLARSASTTIYVPPMPWFEAGPLPTVAGGLTYVGLLGHRRDRRAGRSSRRSSSRTWSQPWRRSTESSASAWSIATSPASSDRRPSAKPRPANHVAVHIRSGDLFDRPDPHPNFVQPPLAFYTLALSHFAEARRDAEVTLVYEDEANPVIPALRAFLESSGTPYSVSSGVARRMTSPDSSSTARSYSAEGASVPLSQHSRRVSRRSTFPGTSRGSPGWCGSGAWTDISSKRSRPATSRLGEWTNSDEQRGWMIGYPADNLSIAKLQ